MGMKEECKCPIISIYKPIKHLNEAYILNAKYNDSCRAIVLGLAIYGYVSHINHVLQQNFCNLNIVIYNDH